MKIHDDYLWKSMTIIYENLWRLFMKIQNDYLWKLMTIMKIHQRCAYQKYEQILQKKSFIFQGLPVTTKSQLDNS